MTRGRTVVRVAGLVLATVILGLSHHNVAEAAGGSLSISPAYVPITIDTAAPQTQYAIELSNTTAAPQTLKLSAVDFGSLDETGGVAFLGRPAGELDHRYGLASWMALDRDTVTVSSGGSARVVVSLQNRASLAPGGHYGAVLATAATDAGGGPAGPKVGVRQVLSSLILAQKPGGAAPRLTLVTQTATHSAAHLPEAVAARFHNLGNVHVVPRGVTELRDPTGHLVARGALNAESSIILPDTYRRYNTPLVSVATAWLPGRYELATTYRYDGTDTTKTGTIYVWYAGRLVVWGGLAAGLLLVGLLVWWLRWRGGWQWCRRVSGRLRRLPLRWHG